jgi:hypothetical protein
VNERSHQSSFRLSQLRTVAGIDGNVAERSRTVVLDIDVCGGEELNEDGNSASVDQLLPVVIWSRVSTGMSYLSI